MNKWILLLIIVLMIPPIVLVGSSITGMSASVNEQSDVNCNMNTKIDFLIMNNIKQICQKNNEIFFIIANQGTTPIEGLWVEIEANYNLTMILKESVSPGSASQHRITFMNPVPGMKNIRVHPLAEKMDKSKCVGAEVISEIGQCWW
jgi:hypothetical protein